MNDLYAKMCVRDVFKNMNVKVFNLKSRTNKARHTKSHERFKCKCRLGASVCNNKQRWNCKNKQRWNEDKCRSECKALIDKGVCDKAFIWNPSNCKCECNKSRCAGEYLYYENCKCRKRLVD